MEPKRPDPTNITPGRANKPVQRRAVFSDFTPRRPAPPQPAASAQPRPAASVSMHTPAPVVKPPHIQPPVHSRTDGEPAPAKLSGLNRYIATPLVKPIADEHNRQGRAGDTAPTAKPRSTNGHAGVVGAAVFIILAALAVSPLLSGRNVSLPGNSQSLSNGDTIPCITNLTDEHITSVYTVRNGFPLTYSYRTSETMHAACGSKQASGINGHTSGFNPLGGVIDLLAAAVIAVVAAKIWAFASRRRQ